MVILREQSWKFVSKCSTWGAIKDQHNKVKKIYKDINETEGRRIIQRIKKAKFDS